MVGTLLVALMFAALSIDAGRLWLERRSLQKTADSAAIAAARFTGCGSTLNDATAAAVDMASTHGLNAADVITERGVLSINAQRQSVFTANNIAHNGARVTLTKRKVPASILLGGLFGDTLDITAVGVAEGGPPVATYSVGSVYGISAQGAQQITNLFRGFLGNSAPDLDPAEINALVKSTVTLAALQAAAGAASLNDFLQMQMTVRQLLDLINKASPDAAAQQSFKELYNASGSSGVKLTVGQILSIQSPAASGVLTANISVFELINAGISVGALNQGGLINLSLGLPILGKTTLSILSPPIIAIGPAGKDSNGNWCSQSRSAQMSLRATVNPLGLGLVDLAVRVDTFSTVGHLETLSVVPGDISGLISTQSTIIKLVLTRSADLNNDISSPDNFRPGTLLGGVFGLFAYAPVGESANKNTAFQVRTSKELPTQKQLGAGSVGSTIAGLLGQQTYVELTALGFLKVPIGLLDDVLRLITVPLGNALDQILEGMGILTGSVRLQVLDVKAPEPELRR